jgi:hypothetical protein
MKETHIFCMVSIGKIILFPEKGGNDPLENSELNIVQIHKYNFV